MDAGFLEFAERFGLPFALVLFALVTGALGKWYFGSVVTQFEKQHDEQVAELKEQHKARIEDKDEEIKEWRDAAKLAVEAARVDAQISQESLRLVKEANEALARIERRLERQQRAQA